jgi:hypothetical protein
VQIDPDLGQVRVTRIIQVPVGGKINCSLETCDPRPVTPEGAGSSPRAPMQATESDEAVAEGELDRLRHFLADGVPRSRHRMRAAVIDVDELRAIEAGPRYFWR